MCKKIIRVDTAFGHDYTGLTTIDTKDGTIESRIIRTDNPDMNSWLYGFMEDSKIINNEIQNQRKTEGHKDQH